MLWNEAARTQSHGVLPAAGSKPNLSVSFHNFWRDFDPPSSFFFKALSQRFNIRVEKAGRDLQISSVFGLSPLPQIPGVRPLRVWWTGEVQDPRGTIFDLHFGFHPMSILGTRWQRYPFWISYIDWWDQTSPCSVTRILGPRALTPRPHFCSFIYSNVPSIRTEFFHRLNETRPVESLGRYLNNRGRRLEGRRDLIDALARSRFNIAFENQISPGYVTEKLVNPLMAGAIPIYWGAKEALTDFNPSAFIYAADFANLDDLVRHVLKVADSKDAMTELATAPAFRDNRIPYEFTPDCFVDRIEEALSRDLDAVVPERWNLAAFVSARYPGPARPWRTIKRRLKRLLRPV
jgi:hypothetical protein